MPIEMPKGLPFSVDTWSPSSKRKRYHFLTHAHKDHCSQMNLHSVFPIYATRLTKALVLRQNPHLCPSLFVEIEVGQSLFVDDPDCPFSVAAFDANHCPGAVMFLFEGNFGNILHTGDCRLTAECLQGLPMKYTASKGRHTKCSLDYLFLDCTFGGSFLKLPSKRSAIQQVINCIWKHPHAPVVYLACGLLGQEEVLVEVSRTFGSKIYVDKTKNAECFQEISLTAPQILTDDSSCRFQVLEGFPRLYERAKEMLMEARANLKHEPLFIRPSTQWYTCEERAVNERQSSLKLEEAEKDQFGVWHTCYSMHSSREELEWALELLQPKWVISTTPPCRAMELDYVKNHCYTTKLTRDDPLWKLLNIRVEKSSGTQISNPSVKDDFAVAVAAPSVPTMDSAGCKLPSPSNSSLNVSFLSCEKPLTLFGKARLFLQDPATSHKLVDKEGASHSTNEKHSAKVTELEKPKDFMFGRKRITIQDSNVLFYGESENVCSKVDSSKSATCETLEKSFSFHECKDANRQTESSGCREAVVENASPRIRASKGFDAGIRKLYRSMNVPVPRPLPSLAELMGVGKRTKISFMQEKLSPSNS